MSWYFGMERDLLEANRRNLCACLHDPDEPPRKPTAARVEGVSDDRGRLVDIMGDTPPADVVDVDPAVEVSDPGFDASLEPDFGGGVDLGFDGGLDLGLGDDLEGF